MPLVASQVSAMAFQAEPIVDDTAKAYILDPVQPARIRGIHSEQAPHSPEWRWFFHKPWEVALVRPCSWRWFCRALPRCARLPVSRHRHGIPVCPGSCLPFLGSVSAW